MFIDTISFLRRAPLFIAALLILIGAVPDATRAQQDYEIILPASPHFFFESGTYVILKNLTVDTLEFDVHHGGDSTFIFNDADIVDNKMKVFNKWGTNEGYITVFFRPVDGAVSHAWLQIDHGNRSDTIYFEGQDTTYAWRSQADLKIMNTHPFIFTPGAADSVDFYIKYKNFGTTDMRAEFDMYNISRGYAFNVVSPSPSVAKAGILDSVLVRFFNDKKTFPANAILTLKNYGYFKDSIMLTALGPVKTAGAQPEFDFVSFYDLSPGETACHPFTIINPNDKPMIISGPYSGMNGYARLTDVTFPITIPANGSQTMNVCITVPDSISSGSLIYGYFRIGYTDMLGVTTSRDVAIPAWIDPCFTLETDSLTFESTIVGGWVDADITIVNNTPNALSLKADFETNNGRVYPVDKRQYIDVPANGSTTKTIRLQPKGVGLVESWLRLNPGVGSGCSEFTFGRYWGYGVADNNDSVSLDLFPDQKETMVLKGANQPVQKLFKFTNNTSSNITVESVSLKSGIHFSISSTDPSSLPVTLAPSATLYVTLAFNADTNGMYRDSLIIVTSGAATSQIFSIHGLQESAGTSDVKLDVIEPVTLYVSPNPSDGPIAISLKGASVARLEIMTVLGTSIYSVDINEQATWSASDLANGVYIIRVSGYDDNGAPFTLSHQLQLKR
jgi:hypothetical protein